MADWSPKWLPLFLITTGMIATPAKSGWPWENLPSLFPEANEELHLTTMEMAAKYGFPSEKHTVTTADGYILVMHRIPYGRFEPTSSKRGRHGPAGRTSKHCSGNKPVVFLQHGYGSSSLHWLMLGPDQGLGFYLASLGYDVWMANSRGNVYSRSHVTFNVSDSNGPFWNFSWQEMAEFDAPVLIDYVLAATGQPSLIAIGYSQGGTQLLALLSEKPKYNAKIRALLLMAPLVFFTGPTMAKRFASLFKDTLWLENLYAIREEKATSREGIDEVNRHCGDGSIIQELCATSWSLQFEIDRQQINASQMPAVIGHFEGASSKQRLHYFQLAKSGEFAKFDYRLPGNIAAYGQKTPPAYNMSLVTAPVSLHYCQFDSFTDASDIDLLYSKLGNPIGKFLVPHPRFGHMGFLVAKDIKKLVYEQLASIMKDY